MAARLGPAPGDGRRDPLRVHRLGGGARPVRADLGAILRRPPGRHRRAAGGGGHGALLARLVGRDRLRGPLAGRRATLPRYPQRADLRAQRRHRRRRHDLSPRDPRRLQELGLPLLLAARQRLHPQRAGGSRIARRSPRLAAVDAAGRRRRSHRSPDHVRHRRHPPAAGVRVVLAARLRRRLPRPRRQRRRRPGPGRRPRRGALRRSHWPRRGYRSVGEGLGAATLAGRTPGESVEGAGQRYLGVARPQAALRVLEGHVLGGVSLPRH